MKNAFLILCRTTLKKTPLLQLLGILSILLWSSHLVELRAQQDPVLSIQGILKKASGEAVADGNYSLTFKLYIVETGGTAIWTENQMDVEVISGIYSTVLGNITPLNISFNQIYYLGVTVGSTEMTPRIQLTSAPYALSLIGETNQFPSSGQVIADSVEVNGNVLTQNGAPGPNGSNKNGYGFLGDRDSGLYSTAAGEVSLYVNNAEIVEVKPALVDIKTDATVDNLNLKTEGKVSYNGLDDWRLVETDYFETDAEGWKVYNPTNGALGAWSNPNGNAATVTTFDDDFAGKALVNNAHMQVFKKNYTPPGGAVAGSYTYVKVVFKYYFLNSWDLGAEENGWAAFSKTENCTSLSVGWFDHPAYVSFGSNLGNNQSQFGPAANFVNGDQGNSPAQWSDQWKTAEMIGRFPSGPSNTNFWVIFGCANNEAPGTESFGVGMIEIWVK